MEEHFTSLVEAGYQVRPASYADLPQIVALFNAYEREFVGAGDCTIGRYGDGWRQSGIDAEARAFRDHWGYVERPFEESFERWKKHRFGAAKLQLDLWFLALARDEIAGQINSPERDDLDASMGWIATVGIRKSYRQRGVGQALLLHAFHELQALGVPRAALMVDATNRTGATRLYERVGMRVQHEFAHYEFELRPGRELAVVD